MKIGRNELKSLIKECLLEVLQEGIGETITESRNNKTRQRRAMHDDDDSILERRVERPRPNVQALKSKIEEVAGGNSVMKSILADTAATTLQEQIGAESSTAQRPSTSVENQILDRNPLDQVFGEESTSKWAKLAFNSQPTMHAAPLAKHTRILESFELDQPAIK